MYTDGECSHVDIDSNVAKKVNTHELTETGMLSLLLTAIILIKLDLTIQGVRIRKPDLVSFIYKLDESYVLVGLIIMPAFNMLCEDSGPVLVHRQLYLFYNLFVTFDKKIHVILVIIT